MRRFFAALAGNDLRNGYRDSLVVGIALLPWLLVLLVRIMVPGMTRWLAQAHAFDLTPYYPLILSLLFLINIPLYFGAVTGFLILDERDERTLLALRVTPLPMKSYAAYRAVAAVVLGWLYIAITAPLSGLLPLRLLPAFLMIALPAALLGPALGLFMALIAGNKVEGFAVVKALGVLIVGPLAAYFVGPPWQWIFGALPTYWPARAAWLALAGQGYGPHLAVGLLYFAVILVLLVRRFHARLAGG